MPDVTDIEAAESSGISNGPSPDGAHAAEVVATARPGSGLTHLVGRVTATARNVAEVVRYGGLETDEQASPFTVDAEQDTYRLRHYFADDPPAAAPAILLVPPLMLTSEVWDVSPRTSAVANLHERGVDPWVVDFGHPDQEPGGLQRTLTDHVLAVSDAVAPSAGGDRT